MELVCPSDRLIYLSKESTDCCLAFFPSSKQVTSWLIFNLTNSGLFSLSCSLMHSQACLNFHKIIFTLGSCLWNNCQLFSPKQGSVCLTNQWVWMVVHRTMVVVPSFAHSQVVPQATHEQHTEQRSAHAPPPQTVARSLTSRTMSLLCSLARPMQLSLTRSFVYVMLLLLMRTAPSCLVTLPPPASLV